MSGLLVHPKYLIVFLVDFLTQMALAVVSVELHLEVVRPLRIEDAVTGNLNFVLKQPENSGSDQTSLVFS